MTKTILDQEDRIEKNIHFKRSLKRLKAASLLLLLFFVVAITTSTLESFVVVIAVAGMGLFLGAVIFSILGIISGIKSYIHGESHSPKRFMVLVGNIFILFLFGMLVVANIMDLMRSAIE